MELSGALSSPQVPLELGALIERKADLLLKRRRALHHSRIAPRRASVASIVYKVISEAANPMRAKDIHRACEDELGRPVSWSTVKTCLSDHSSTLGRRPVAIAKEKPFRGCEPGRIKARQCAGPFRSPGLGVGYDGCAYREAIRDQAHRRVVQYAAIFYP
jgi:hypothetical protein